MGVTGVEGFYVNAGWGTWGFKATPIAGVTMAELVATGRVPELIAPFRRGPLRGAPRGAGGAAPRAPPRRGTLTLSAPEGEGEREPGALVRVAFRVRDLESALARLPADLPVERRGGGALFAGPEGLGLGLLEAAGGGDDIAPRT